jgi:hypothetical protein
MKYSYKTIKEENGRMIVTATGRSTLGNVFVGRAVCAPADKFDFSLGASIARRRANIKRLTLMALNNDKKLDDLQRAKEKAWKRENQIAEELEGEFANLECLLRLTEE